MADTRTPFGDLLKQYSTRSIDRRQFLARAAAAGAGAAAGAALLGAAPTFAQDTTPEGTPVDATPAGTPSSAGPGKPTQLLKDRDAVKQAFLAKFPKPDNAKKGGAVVDGYNNDITTTNIILSGDDPTNPVMGLVFESLTGSSAVDGDYVPGLADSCELSADGLKLTYKLHKGVKWHDGKDFTVDDVVMSHDAQGDPDTASSYTGSFTDTVASYRKVDDLTFELTMTDTFNRVVAFGNTYCPIMPAHLWKDVKHADWAADKGSTGEDPSRVIGTGFLKFQEWKQNDRVTLVRNDGYWDDVPNIDTFTFRVYPSVTAAVEAIQANEIDTLYRPNASDVQTLKDAGLDVLTYDTYSFSFYGFNLDETKTPLFQDKELRQALFYGLDRASIVKNIYLGFGEVAQGTQPTLSIAYKPDEIKTKYTYDPDKAKQLLDSAGWKAGSDGIRAKDGNKLEFEVMYSAGSTSADQLVAYMQDAWKALGAKMTPNAVDFSTVLIPAITATFDYQIALLGFSWDYSGDQSAMFATSAYGANGFNFMKYSNKKYDQLAKDANVEQDSAKRIDLLVQASNIANDDAPTGIIYFNKFNFVVNGDRVKGYYANALGGRYFSLEYCSINE